MKTLIISTLLFFSFHLTAGEVVWKLGKTFIPMSQNDSKRWLISLHCETDPCEALQQLQMINVSLLKKNDLAGGKNPGAVLCHKLPGASVVFMDDLSGNQNSFCKFKDGSIVSNSTLVIYAEANTKK